MSGIIGRLRAERERRRILRVEVSRATGIYAHHLAALEHGNLDELPDDEVVEGYIRAYAEYLGQDPDEAIEEFRRRRGIPTRAEGGAGLAAETSEPREAPAPEETRGVQTDEAGAPAEREPTPGVEAAAESVERAVPEPIIGPGRARAPEEPAASTTPEAPGRSRGSEVGETPGRRTPWIAAAAAVVVLAVAGWILLRPGDRGEGSISPPSPSAAGTVASKEEPTVPREQAAGPDRPGRRHSDRAPEVSSVPETGGEAPVLSSSAVLSVPDCGVGTGVVDHRLVGTSDRFAPGTKVWFWTLVAGGSRGDVVRHVWIREGRVVTTVTLPVGSARWRTQSFKTLPARRSEGRWAVEARDEAGNVLARAEFVCAPLRNSPGG